ncbi:hypothetical protein R6Q59_025350 [Mikania micrantha]
MFGLKKPHFHHRISKTNSVDPGFPGQHASNPFDSDDESGKKSNLTPERRTSSEPSVLVPDSRTALFDDDVAVKGSGYKVTYASRNKYKNDFVDSGGLENQDVQELEHYAAYKAEETTKTVNSALKIAENIREDATKTVITLHQQGEQITRTHMTAADIEQDLSRGEKLLGSLGGIFSRTWKPKKGHTITGPVTTRDDPAQRKGAHLEQREKLGLTTTQTKGHRNSRTPPPEPTNALQKVEVFKFLVWICVILFKIVIILFCSHILISLKKGKQLWTKLVRPSKSSFTESIHYEIRSLFTKETKFCHVLSAKDWIPT